MIAYATVEQIKNHAPDTFGSTTDYDDLLRRLAFQASQLIDRLCKRGSRAFLEQLQTLYFDGNGERDLWIPPLLSLTSAHISSNDGQSYSQLAAGDYLLLGGVDEPRYDEVPHRVIRLSKNGTFSQWYEGQQSAKVIGLWGWHDDYSNAWEDSQDTVEDDPLSSSATSLTVNDADGDDRWGQLDRFQVGQFCKIESEQVLITERNATTNVLTIERAQNGTTAAEHAQNTAISIWRPGRAITMATIIQAIQWFKRGQQAFQDTSVSAQLGTLMYTKELDPNVVSLLSGSGIRRASI